jgi:hypothetical protein
MPRYTNDFEPILLEGQTATLYGSMINPEGKHVICRAVDAVPEITTDFGALTATTWDTDQEEENLEVGTMELAQWRMRVVDDMIVRLKNPASVQKWRTSKTSAYLPQFPQNDDEFLKVFLWKASEFFVFEDHTPRFDLYADVDTDTAMVRFSGWKFKLKALPAGQVGKIIIWVDTWPAVSGA